MKTYQDLLNLLNCQNDNWVVDFVFLNNLACSNNLLDELDTKNTICSTSDRLYDTFVIAFARLDKYNSLKQKAIEDFDKKHYTGSEAGLLGYLFDN